MQKALSLALILILSSGLAFAQSVDTVNTYERGNITWATQTLREQFEFPDGSKEYEKIIMRYTMLCPIGFGCDPWDVIASVYAEPQQENGEWSGPRWEIGRFITPYGGSFGSNWSWTWEIDVTNYMSILKDSVQLDVNGASYTSGGEGFDYTIDFVFYEGQLDMIPFKVENLWQTFPSYYGSPEYASENSLTPQGLLIHPQADSAVLRMVTTGHGFGDGVHNSAEFYCNYHTISINNGEKEFLQDYWRNDCEINPLSPQAGTWWWNRAGWCPGDYVYPNDYDISDYLDHEKGKVTIDYDLAKFVYSPTSQPSTNPNTGGTQIGDCVLTGQPYTYAGGGSRPAYKIESQVFLFKERCDESNPPTLSLNATDEFEVDNAGTGDIKWYVDGLLLPQSTGSTLTPIKEGNYMVAVTDASGCTKMSDPVQYLRPVGVDELSALVNFQVVPNPTSTSFVLNLELAEPADIIINIANLNGHSVYQLAISNAQSVLESIDVSNLSAGVYIISAQSKGEVVRKKLMIAK